MKLSISCVSSTYFILLLDMSAVKRLHSVCKVLYNKTNLHLCVYNAQYNDKIFTLEISMCTSEYI